MSLWRIRVVVARPDERAEVVEIDNDLATLQELVGGHIEAVPLEAIDAWLALKLQRSETPLLHLYANEDGYREELAINLHLPGHPMPIVGPIVASKASPTTGEEIGLSPELAELVRRWLDEIRGMGGGA